MNNPNMYPLKNGITVKIKKLKEDLPSEMDQTIYSS